MVSCRPLGRLHHCSHKTKTLLIGSWNVRTLLDLDISDPDSRPKRRTALVAHELRRYNIDIAALSETRLSGEDSLIESGEGYTFFWRGLPEGERRLHGVGFAVKTSLLLQIPEIPVGINERIMSWRIPLSKNQYVTIFSVYAPTLVAEEAEKDHFYSILDAHLQSVHHGDKLILLGDFNARVGRDHEIWPDVLGKHGIGKANENGIRLLTLCSEHQLIITNTCFQLKKKYKTTWKHPRSGHWHQLDHVIVRQTDRKEVLITRVMRGAECWTDHRLIRCKIRLVLRPRQRKNPPAMKLNTKALEDPAARALFRSKIATDLSAHRQPQNIPAKWDNLHSTLLNAAKDTIGLSKRRHQDWFDQNATSIHCLIEKKRKLHDAFLNSPQSREIKSQFTAIRGEVQRTLRKMENEWWKAKSCEIQSYADANNIQGFYNAAKTIYGPKKHSNYPVRSADGNTLYKNNSQILSRWAEHFENLLNQVNPTAPHILDELPNLPMLDTLDESPHFSEVLRAISELKNNKSPGPDGVPAEIYKHGGYLLKRRLYELITEIWTTEIIPQTLKDANIVTIFKKKGDKAICGNSRGISLLAVAGKILAKIMLSRLITQIAENSLPESQCGFRKDRSTTDMIFSLRQLQEKSREQNKDLFIAFIDLTKAFDTVNRSLLWSLLEKSGVPPKFLNILKQFHDGMQARVQTCNLLSDPFEVRVGVKQGCVLAPVLFNIFLMALTNLSHAALDRNAGVTIQYRLDGSLFNLRRLQARTKVFTTQITELQYADDCAIVAHDPDSLQTALDVFSATYSAMGLKVNTMKTEILTQCRIAPQIPFHFHINEEPIKVVEHFNYLGSLLSSDCSADLEIQRRISLAAAAFGRLNEQVFLNKNLRLDTKASVYKAVCLSTLLYGSETWTIYKHQVQSLEKFNIRCLRKILGVSWKDKITYDDLYQRTNTCSIEATLAQRHLRWLGHNIRMPEYRLPRQILYSQLAEGQRNAGGVKKRFKDLSKQLLKRCNIPPQQLETLAVDRCAWRAACDKGTTQLEEALSRKRAEKRTLRHELAAGVQPPAAQHPCQICAKICGSRIGLNSHVRWHQRQNN